VLLLLLSPPLPAASVAACLVAYRAMYYLSAALLSAGIILLLLKGFDYEEAVVLAVMLGVLLPCRRHFYRQASLLSQRFTPGWIVAVTLHQALRYVDVPPLVA
jgi:lysylphosphatidylglycerol synthetase-like protein (DUF2156 family)